MSKSNWELWALVIAIIEFDVNYYVYSITKSALDILTIIVASMILVLIFVLLHIYSKIGDVSESQEEFDKKLIMHKELEDIRLDLRELKRKVFRK